MPPSQVSAQGWSPAPEKPHTLETEFNQTPPGPAEGGGEVEVVMEDAIELHPSKGDSELFSIYAMDPLPRMPLSHQRFAYMYLMHVDDVFCARLTNSCLHSHIFNYSCTVHV